MRDFSPEKLGVTWTYAVLSTKVLAVAFKGDIDDWAAYIGSVSGHNHLLEAEEVARRGSKLPYEIAKLLFPTMDRTYKWRP